MNLIKRIEIKHFRSIYETVIEGLSDINVFSGLNDAGKSNVIKALNVFFNNAVDKDTPFSFERDTSSWHSHRSSAGHSKKLVTIRLTFRRPSRRYEKSLPEEFWIERYWDLENQYQPKTTWGSLDFEKSWDDRPRALTEFMNRSHFFYVPAIRDRDYFRHLLLQYSKSIRDTASLELESATETLSRVMARESTSLRYSLKELTNLDFVLKLPDSLLALLEASGLYTEDDKSLQLRGDGIQGLAVAGILGYLTNVKTRDFYYWGFEEPENSLEYLNSTKLAEKIESKYSKKAQIFLSTHSPAFLSMESTKTSTFKVSKSFPPEFHGHAEEISVVEPVFVSGHDTHAGEIVDELGFFDLVRRVDREYREFESNKEEVEDILAKLQGATKPHLIVEGKLDLETLEYAWKGLYCDPMPFDVLPAGSAGKITSLLCNSRSSVRQILALYDHDDSGVAEIRKLINCGFTEAHCDPYLQYRFQPFIVAQTLPAPPGRECNAENLNLPLEFYFADEVLLDVHNRSGKKLFSENNYVKDREHYHVEETNLKDDFAEGKITMCHRKLDTRKGKKKSGKRILLEHLPNLSDEDFQSFDMLFTVILDYFDSGFVPKRKLSTSL